MMFRRARRQIMDMGGRGPIEFRNEAGAYDEDLVANYGRQWRVEWNFKGKKRPVMVERLFMKDPGRAAALITLVDIAALVRATVQLLMRRGIDALPDDDLPELGRSGAKLRRNATYDHFMESCMNCRIRYDPGTNRCGFSNSNADTKASAYLQLMGIPRAKLFTGGVRRGRTVPEYSLAKIPRVRNVWYRTMDLGVSFPDRQVGAVGQQIPSCSQTVLSGVGDQTTKDSEMVGTTGNGR